MYLITTHRRITATFLAFRNKQQAAARVRVGKSALVVDTSLEKYMKNADVDSDENTDGIARNEQAFDDLTDSKNEDFIFVL